MCSSHQAHNNYTSFTVRSPLRSELSVKFFLLWGGGRSFARLWCVVSESANWVCLLLSILSIPFILYSLALGSALCVLFHGALRFLEGVFNRPSWLFIVGVVFLGYPCSGFLLGQYLALNHCLFFYAGFQTDHLDLRCARARRLSHTPALYCSSIFYTFFRLGLHCVCASTVHPAFEQRRFVTVASICNLRRHFFLYFRARYFGVILVFFGGSCSKLTLWNSGAEFLPFCRRAIFSFVGRYSLLLYFDGDDSTSNSVLRGFLTAANTSCSLDF